MSRKNRIAYDLDNPEIVHQTTSWRLSKCGETTGILFFKVHLKDIEDFGVPCEKCFKKRRD